MNDDHAQNCLLRSATHIMRTIAIGLATLSLTASAIAQSPVVTEFFYHDDFTAAVRHPLTIIDFDDQPRGNGVVTKNTFEGLGMLTTHRDGFPINIIACADNIFLTDFHINSPTNVLSADFLYGDPYFERQITNNIDFTLIGHVYAAGLWIGSLPPDYEQTEVAFLGDNDVVLAGEVMDDQHVGLIGTESHNNRIFYGIISNVPIRTIRTTEGPQDGDSITYDDIQIARTGKVDFSSNDAGSAAEVIGSVEEAMAALNAGPTAAADWQPITLRFHDSHESETFPCPEDPSTSDTLVCSDHFLAGVDEVSLNNCASAFYRFTFEMPSQFANPGLHVRINANELFVAFLNGQLISPAMTAADLDEALLPDYLKIYPLRNCDTAAAEAFNVGTNELVIGVLNGDALSPCGLEFEASVVFDGVVGDVNCDGYVDVFDIDPFVHAITQNAGFEALYPAGDLFNADANCDGTVDAFDIDRFVNILIGIEPPSCVR